MLRKLLKDSLVYSLAIWLSRGIGLLMIPVYTRLVTTGEYGTLDLLLVAGNLINLTLTLEIAQGVARYLAESKCVAQKVAYASTAFWFTLVCYAAFLALGLTFASSLAEVAIGDSGGTGIVRLSLLQISLSGLYLLLTNELKWELRSGAYAKNLILVALGSAIASFVLAGFFGWGLPGLLLGIIIGNACGCLHAGWSLRDRLALQFNWRFLGRMLAYSAPLAVSGVGVFLNTYVDRLVINHYLGIENVGIYGVACKLAGVAGLATIGIQSAVTPLIYNNEDQPNTKTQLEILFRLFVAGSLLFVLGWGLFSPEITSLFLPDAYSEAAVLIVILSPAILLSRMYIFAPGLGLAKKTVSILLINIVAGVANLTLNWIMVPIWGAIGGACSTLVCSMAAFTLYMLGSQRHYPVPHHCKPLLLAAGATAVLLGLGQQLEEINLVGVVIKLGMIGVLATVIYLLGIARRPEFVALYRSLRSKA